MGALNVPASATGRHDRIAIVDGASFVLPYDHGLISGLARQGRAVSFFASRTRYNEAFLQALQADKRVDVQAAAVSGTVAPRWRGVLAYAGMLRQLWQRRREWAGINLQFSVLWPLELPLLALLRRRFVFTVHNAVPHGFGGVRHRPTQWLAALARRLVFISEATRDDFLRRYGDHHATKATLLPHGTLPLAPGLAPQPYRARPAPEALVYWSTVKPYKGVELLAALARSPEWRERGLPLEVVGAWDASLHPLREELRGLGVKVVDRYLGAAELRSLFARNVLFVLPYQQASQSGALYTLLHHGAPFICSDTGDLGRFLRSAGLRQLLLKDRTPAAMLECLAHARMEAVAVAAAFQRAQHQLQWDHLLAASAAYAPFTDR